LPYPRARRGAVEGARSRPRGGRERQPAGGLRAARRRTPHAAGPASPLPARRPPLYGAGAARGGERATGVRGAALGAAKGCALGSLEPVQVLVALDRQLDGGAAQPLDEERGGVSVEEGGGLRPLAELLPQAGVRDPDKMARLAGARRG